MAISAKLVKQLRDLTGAGMMDCKKALSECGGDIDEAKLYLQKKGIAASQKRAGRTASEGTVVAWSDDDQRSGLLIEVNCETDFVSRSPGFQSFASELAGFAGRQGIGSVSQLLEVDWDGQSTKERILQHAAKTGEKTDARRLAWARVPESQLGRVGHYIHAGGKIGVVLAMTAAAEDDLESEVFATLLKDMAMHIAASSPLVVSADDLNADLVARQTEIFTAQAEETGKPPHIAEKIAVGRLNKWKGEVTLLKQPFVKQLDTKVDKFLAAVAKDHLTGPVGVVEFVRYQVGEGIEKKVDNLAEEVAALRG